MSCDILTQWLQPLSPRSKRSYLSWDVPGCPGISRHSGYSPLVPGPSGSIRPGMSQDVLGYPDTVATAPESQVQVVLSVLECPRMSWDIPTQWLQPQSPRSKRSYLSWDVPGCPGISRHSGYSPLVPGPSGPICPGMSQDVLGYPDTVATAPESKVQVVLSVLGCPRMSWDIPTQWLQPLSPGSKWSYLSWDVPGCPGISRHSGYSPRVPGPRGPICPGMSQDVLGYPDTVATAP